MVRLFISLLLGTIVSWGAEEPPDLRLYVAALRDKDPAVRESAALAISKKEGDGASAAPYLAEATADPDPNVRLAAIQALGAVKSESALAVGALIKCLDGGEGSIRRAAAKALGSIGKAAAAAEPALLKKLSNNDVDMENAAVSALGKIRGNSEVIIDNLLGVLGKGNCGVDEQVLYTVADILDVVAEENLTGLSNGMNSRAIDAATRLLDSPCRDTRLSSLAALQRLLPKDAITSETLALFVAKAEDRDEDIRYAAIRTMSAMKSHEAIETLIARATKDPDFRVRIRATKQLTAGRDLEAIAGLVQALNDSSGEVRRTALDRLGTVEIGKRSVCRELAQLVDDPDVTVKRILAERLSLCDGGVQDGSAALFTAAADLDSQCGRRP